MHQAAILMYKYGSGTVGRGSRCGRLFFIVLAIRRGSWVILGPIDEDAGQSYQVDSTDCCPCPRVAKKQCVPSQSEPQACNDQCSGHPALWTGSFGFVLPVLLDVTMTLFIDRHLQDYLASAWECLFIGGQRRRVR